MAWLRTGLGTFVPVTGPSGPPDAGGRGRMLEPD